MDAARRGLGRSGDHRDGERRDDRGECRESRVRLPLQSRPQRDAHPAEEQRREKC
jgi:hypothetical protein